MNKNLIPKKVFQRS